MRAMTPLVMLGALVLLILVAGEADAQTYQGASGNREATVAATAALGFRGFCLSGLSGICTVATGEPATVVDPTTQNGHIVNAGASKQLYCTETASGNTPPDAPDANGITVTFYRGNAARNSATGADIIRTLTFSSCTTAQSILFYCTSDGTSTGAPRWGAVRMYIKVMRTGLGSYSGSSDGGLSGASNTGRATDAYIFCAPATTAMTISHAGVMETLVGGDTLRNSVTLDAADYDPATTFAVKAGCDPENDDVTIGNIAGSTSATTSDVTIQGTFSTWPDDCTARTSLHVTRLVTAASTDWNTAKYATFSTTSVGGTYNSDHSTRSSNPLTVDRTLTVSSCSGSPSTFNRGETVALTCTWKNARNEAVPNAKPYTAYATRVGQPWRDTTDFLSGTGTFSGSTGALTHNLAAKTTATVSTQYRFALDTFTDTSRTDAVLQNVGNGTVVLTVSATGTFDEIRVSKSSGGPAASSFIIGTHVEYTRAMGLRDVSGNALSGKTVVCTRNLPDGSADASFDQVTMGTTDASGHSPTKALQVGAPESPPSWSTTCTATWDGNTATRTVSYEHISAYTGNMGLVLSWNVTPQSATTFRANITMLARKWDPATDGIERLPLDDVARLTVLKWNPVSGSYATKVVDRQLMTLCNPTNACEYYHLDFALSDTGWPFFAFATANATGRPLMGSEYWNFTVASNISCNGCVITGDFVDNAWANSSVGFCRKGTSPDEGCVGNRYANATLEGQQHANSTWCAISGCTATDNAVGNTWFNSSAAPWESRTHANATWCQRSTSTTPTPSADTGCVGDRYANATFEGQAHANATWCPLTVCIASSTADTRFESQKHANDTWCATCAPVGWVLENFETQEHARQTYCTKTQSCAWIPEDLTVGNLTVLGHLATGTISIDPQSLEVVAQTWGRVEPVAPSHAPLLAGSMALLVGGVVYGSKRRVARRMNALSLLAAGVLLLVVYARVRGLI